MVGQAIKRREDPRLITGQGSFLDDIRLHRLSQAAILRSPYGHAKINNIDTSSPEKASLQALLKTLHAETSKLIEALPDKDDAERAARNLRNLTEAATAKKPDPKWFEVSAEGLLEAAKAVAALTAPVTTAVKAVLGFFAK